MYVQARVCLRAWQMRVCARGHKFLCLGTKGEQRGELLRISKRIGGPMRGRINQFSFNKLREEFTSSHMQFVLLIE